MEDFKDTSGSLVGEDLRYGKCVFGYGLFARRGGEMGCLDKEFVLRYDGYVERAFAFASYTAKCMFASLDYFARKCGMVSV